MIRSRVVAFCTPILWLPVACSEDQASGVGDECRPVVVPEGGLQPGEVYLEHPVAREVYTGAGHPHTNPATCLSDHPRSECYGPNPHLCSTDMCLANHYAGDLELSPLEGDGIAESEGACGADCGWTGIADRIYCTCKCDAPDGADPPTCDSCPGGFECCPLLEFGSAAGSYCVRSGTCP